MFAIVYVHGDVRFAKKKRHLLKNETTQRRRTSNKKQKLDIHNNHNLSSTNLLQDNFEQISRQGLQLRTCNREAQVRIILNIWSLPLAIKSGTKPAAQNGLTILIDSSSWNLAWNKLRKLIDGDNDNNTNLNVSQCLLDWLSRRSSACSSSAELHDCIHHCMSFRVSSCHFLRIFTLLGCVPFALANIIR